MPPPGTYIDITSTPFTRTVTVAEFNAGTFGGTVNSVWFRYVNGPDNNILGNFTAAAGAFTPVTSLYGSDGTTLIQGATNKGFWALIQASETYYFQILKSGGGATASDFPAYFYAADAEYIAAGPGDLIINDDTNISQGPLTGTPRPSAIYSSNGTFLGFNSNLVAGEIGDALPNGTLLAHDKFGSDGTRLRLYNTSQVLIASIDTTPSLGASPFPSICNDGTVFYVTNRSDGKVYTVTNVGVITHIATIPSFVEISATGVKRDGSVLYWTETDPTDSNAIQRHDLNTDLPMADFYTFTGLTSGQIATTTNGFNGEIIVQSDDTLVTWYDDFSLNQDFLVHVSAAGALLASYQYDENDIDHIHYSVQGPTHIVLWRHLNAVHFVGTWDDLNLATGIPLTTFTISMFSGGDNRVAGDNLAFGASSSCYMVTYNYGGGSSVGTVVIEKVVDPSTDTTSFPFVAGGGLSPTSFSLAHGESFTYTGVTAGSGYTIAETVPSGWTVSYSVSNGSPINNLVVTADETTTITVTNGNGTIGFATELPIRWVLRTPIIT